MDLEFSVQEQQRFNAKVAETNPKILEQIVGDVTPEDPSKSKYNLMNAVNLVGYECITVYLASALDSLKSALDYMKNALGEKFLKENLGSNYQELYGV